jgi:outer membrane receptor for ferrienterochelin and colicin
MIANGQYQTVLVRSEDAPSQFIDAKIIEESSQRQVQIDSTENYLLPVGKKYIVSAMGFFSKKINLTTKKTKGDSLHIFLENMSPKQKDIIVLTNKNEAKIASLATRLEVVDNDELNERSLDKPSDVSHALKEQTGVQLQRTSASSSAFNIRLQSLRGKYVQILKDGLPLFGGLSQYLSLPQSSPMMLRQVEIIKGSASTLYGGDAISGVINFISNKPTEKPVYDILINAESTKSVDAAIYASQRFGKFGFNLLGQYRWQNPVDWNGDKFSDYAKINRWQIAPDLYWWVSEKLRLNTGLTYTNEEREGGAMPALQKKGDTLYTYLEKNKSQAFSSKFRADVLFKNTTLSFINGINRYSRKLTVPNYRFEGTQLATFSEILGETQLQKHVVQYGIDLRTEQFSDADTAILTNKNYQLYTVGLFISERFTINEKTILEAGFRLDYNTKYGVVPLPKIAWLQKWNEIFQTRVNIGMGYKLPTIFQDESEEAFYRNVLPIDPSLAKPELSAGGTLDLKVSSPSINGFKILFNNMYFITNIWQPLLPTKKLYKGQFYTQYETQNGTIQGRGIETTLQMLYRGLGLKLSYTLQDQSLNINKVKSVAPLTSKHLIGILIGYEKEDLFSVGMDCYYYSPQNLTDGTQTQGIWEMGINSQYIHRYFTIFANLENILNIRQTSFGPVVLANPTFRTPVFKEIYGPLEGRVLNAGIKIKLGALFKTKMNDDD